jgi:hypothetical protein
MMLIFLNRKTQIALDFARSKSSQLATFWVRADRIENFLLDYRKNLKLLDNDRFQNLPPDNQKAMLNSSLKALEINQSKWLLILDNTDELENFRKESLENICLRDNLPQCGRTLITSRDSRFVGEIVATDEGIQVRSMSPEEAKTILFQSIPPELSGDGPECTDDDVGELNKELGRPPLAIAQAAANIRHLRTSLHSYVRLYRERKRRADLLDQAVHSLRRPPQSVLTTWQISFDHVTASDPTAGLLLSYLGVFHWESIPGALLRRLPGIGRLDTIQFARTVANLLQLALLEQPADDDFQLHPMVHYWISARLDSQDRLQYLVLF